MNDIDTRGFLRTVRVPFNLKAIFLGALAYLILMGGGLVLNEVLGGVGDGQSVISGFIHQGMAKCGVALGGLPVIGNEVEGLVSCLYRGACRSLEWWEFLIVGVWFYVVTSIFGGAITRIMAMRIARDESIGAVAALKFAVKNLASYLLIPVFLGVAIVFFWACNLLAGVASSIPYAGILLFIVAYPLAILSSLIILLIAFGGLLGLFVMISAVSTEKNGTLDAISRAFSYIYSRPLQFFFYYFVIFVLASIIAFVGLGIFPAIVTDSVAAGTWYSPTEQGLASGMSRAVQPALPVFTGLNLHAAAIAAVSWFFSVVLLFGIFGFIVSYFLGGTTAIYFALRREVDGTEDSEVYIEGSEEDEFGLPPPAPVPPAGEAPAPADPAAPAAPAAPPAPPPPPPAEEPKKE